MVEKEVRSKEEILDIIDKIKNKRNLLNSEIERALELSSSSMYKWRDNSPSIDKILRVLNFLGIHIVLRSHELEDDSNEKMEEVEESDLDILIQEVFKKVLKNCNSISKKEMLYKILQAFL